MHSYKNLQFWPREGQFLEHRLLRKDTQDRFRRLEEAEDAEKNRKKKGGKNGFDQLDEAQERLIRRVGEAVDSGWGDWIKRIVPGMTRKDKVMRVLREEAYERIREKAPELDWNKWDYLLYPFRGAKRRMYHDLETRMAKQMGEQLLHDAEAEQNELETLELQFRELKEAFGRGGVRIRKSVSKKESRTKKTLRESTESFGKTVTRLEAEGTGMTPEVKRAFETEKFLRGQLVAHGIVPAGLLNQLFEEQSQAGRFGKTRLEEKIRNHVFPRSRSNNAYYTKLRELLLERASELRNRRTLGLLRSPHEWYRTLYLTEGNPNASHYSLDRFLNEYPILVGTGVQMQAPRLGKRTGHIHARDADGTLEVHCPKPNGRGIERLIAGPPEDRAGQRVLPVVYRDARGEKQEVFVSIDNRHLSFSHN